MALKLVKSISSNYCDWNDQLGQNTSFVCLDIQNKLLYSCNTKSNSSKIENKVGGHILRFEIYEKLTTKRINELLEELYEPAKVVLQKSKQSLQRNGRADVEATTESICDAITYELTLLLIKTICDKTFLVNPDKAEDYLRIVKPINENFLKNWKYDLDLPYEELCKSYEIYLRSLYSEEVVFSRDIGYALKFLNEYGHFGYNSKIGYLDEEFTVPSKK